MQKTRIYDRIQQYPGSVVHYLFYIIIINTTPVCFACICMNQVWSIVDVNTTLLSKDSFELKRNDQQAVFPVKNLIRINNNLLFGE